MKIKKLLALVLLCFMIVGFLPTGIIYAKETRNGGNCSLYPEIRIKEIVDAKVIDGELYIDVIEEPTFKPDMEYGPCPSPYKYVTKRITRKELAEMYNKELNDNEIVQRALSIFLLPLGPLENVIISNLNYGNEQILSEIKNALFTTKKNFTVKTKLKCVQGDMGSRGIVHHYKVESISIK